MRTMSMPWTIWIGRGPIKHVNILCVHSPCTIYCSHVHIIKNNSSCNDFYAHFTFQAKRTWISHFNSARMAFNIFNGPIVIMFSHCHTMNVSIIYIYILRKRANRKMVLIPFINTYIYFSHIVMANDIFLLSMNAFWSVFFLIYLSLGFLICSDFLHVLQSRYRMAFIWCFSQNWSFDSVENIFRTDDHKCG